MQKKKQKKNFSFNCFLYSLLHENSEGLAQSNQGSHFPPVDSTVSASCWQKVKKWSYYREVFYQVKPLSLSGLIQQTTNWPYFSYFFFFFTENKLRHFLQIRRQFAWNVKANFLGKIRIIFQNVCWNFYPAYRDLNSLPVWCCSLDMSQMLTNVSNKKKNRSFFIT